MTHPPRLTPDRPDAHLTAALRGPVPHRRPRLADRPLALARVAGALYLLLVVLGAWAHVVVRGSIHVPGDAAATAAGIVAGEARLQLALGADILMATVFVLLGLALYRLLHPARPRGATALLVFVAVGAVSILLNLVFQVGAVLVATDGSYASALGARGSDALSLLLMDLHAHGYALGGVFFGLWLLPMGYVALRSPMFPRALGILLVAAAAAWVADPVLAFGLPGAPSIVRLAVSGVTTAGELSLLLYLLVRGLSPAGRGAVAANR